MKDSVYKSSNGGYHHYAVDDLYIVLLRNFSYLFNGHSCEAEHSDLIRDVGPGYLRPSVLQLVAKCVSHLDYSDRVIVMDEICCNDIW